MNNVKKKAIISATTFLMVALWGSIHFSDRDTTSNNTGQTYEKFQSSVMAQSGLENTTFPNMDQEINSRELSNQDEDNKDSDITASSELEKVIKSEQGFVVGNTVEDSSQRQAKLDVDWLGQYPELPTGCEITALTTVLNYNGYKVTKETMAEKYLEKSSTGSFYDTFIGDPTTSYGYGCYASPIIKAANKYFTNNHFKSKALNLSGSNFQDLLSYVRQGYPIIIWNTIGMEPAYQTDSWTVGDQTLTWTAPEHCVVLTGYDMDRGVVYVSDPAEGLVERDMIIFEERYESLHRQAVYITSN